IRILHFPFTLYNDDVVITFMNNYTTKLHSLDIAKKTASILYRPSDSISIEIKDAKLSKYNEQIKQNLRKKIKEYNKRGQEKQKKKELKRLDF
ncbi:MAG: hypothetical protein J6C40_13735, partial [Lentisphaeria bacterium]|nr:hypothetical protein [Lentisphaeria bacterium]